MITTAQFTYIPLRSADPRESIDYLLEMVAQHDVEVDVNYLSTSVRGQTEDVFALIKEMYETMTIEGEEFRFHVELLSPVSDDNSSPDIPANEE